MKTVGGHEFAERLWLLSLEARCSRPNGHRVQTNAHRSQGATGQSAQAPLGGGSLDLVPRAIRNRRGLVHPAPEKSRQPYEGRPEELGGSFGSLGRRGQPRGKEANLGCGGLSQGPGERQYGQDLTK